MTAHIRTSFSFALGLVTAVFVVSPPRHLAADPAEGDDAALALVARFTIGNRLGGNWGAVTAIAGDVGRRVVFAAEEGGLIRIWREGLDRTVGSLQAHHTNVERMAVSPNARLLISGDDRGRVVWWDIEGRTVLRDEQVYGGHVFGVSFSSDGVLVVTAGEDGQFGRVHVFRVADRTRVCSVEHKEMVGAVGFLPGEHRVVAGSWDGELSVITVVSFRAECNARGTSTGNRTRSVS